MTDQTTVGTSGESGTGAPPAPTGQAGGQPPASQQPPSQQTDWEARYKGMVRANSEKDQQIQALTAKAAELERQIATVLGEKDTLKATWETRMNEVQTSFAKLKGDHDSAEQQHVDTLAELAKMKALAQHPELMIYADLITPTTDQAALDAQIVKVQQIHGQTVDSARKGLQQQGFAPPAAPPSTSGAVTVDSLTQELRKAQDALMAGTISQSEFSEVTKAIGEQYNLLQKK